MITLPKISYSPLLQKIDNLSHEFFLYGRREVDQRFGTHISVPGNQKWELVCAYSPQMLECLKNLGFNAVNAGQRTYWISGNVEVTTMAQEDLDKFKVFWSHVTPSILTEILDTQEKIFIIFSIYRIAPQKKYPFEEEGVDSKYPVW